MFHRFALLALVSMTACRSYEQAPIGTSESPITSGCNAGTIGLPCDPDDGGPLKECEGICAVQGTGSGGLTVSCVKLSVVGSANNDGKICGSSGTNDCGKYCAGSTCVSGNAPNGAACRPSSGGDICDGQCTFGVCVGLLASSKCPDNKLGDCTYDFCDAKKSTSCIKYPLPKGYSCNDTMSCTVSDVCDGVGKCAGVAKTCPVSSNSCLVNTCDPATAAGTCSGKPIAAGSACTFDKCFAGTCDAAGACVKGAAVSCDDSDTCTTDSCDAATGCLHAAIGGCGVDAGPADTGVADTGVVDTGTVVVDTGTLVVDTGTAVVDTGTAVVDSGSVVVDSGSVVVDSGTPVEEDTGTFNDDTGTLDVDASSDAAETGEDGALGFEETVEAKGCGCRTTSRSSTVPGMALSLLALVTIAARRRR